MEITFQNGVYQMQFMEQKKDRDDIWAHAWGSSFVAASFLDKFYSNTKENQESIEVGAGSCPLPSLILSSKGFVPLVTDASAEALAFSKKLFVNNNIADYNMDVYNWNKDPPQEWSGRFNVFIGSDVLYMSRNIPLIVNSISKCMKEDGLAIISDPGRCFMDEFIESADMHCKIYNFNDFATPLCLIKKASLIILCKSADTLQQHREGIQLAIQHLTVTYCSRYDSSPESYGYCHSLN